MPHRLCSFHNPLMPAWWYPLPFRITLEQCLCCWPFPVPLQMGLELWLTMFGSQMQNSVSSIIQLGVGTTLYAFHDPYFSLVSLARVLLIPACTHSIQTYTRIYTVLLLKLSKRILLLKLLQCFHFFVLSRLIIFLKRIIVIEATLFQIKKKDIDPHSWVILTECPNKQ